MFGNDIGNYINWRKILYKLNKLYRLCVSNRTTIEAPNKNVSNLQSWQSFNTLAHFCLCSSTFAFMDL